MQKDHEIGCVATTYNLSGTRCSGKKIRRLYAKRAWDGWITITMAVCVGLGTVYSALFIYLNSSVLLAWTILMIMVVEWIPTNAGRYSARMFMVASLCFRSEGLAKACDFYRGERNKLVIGRVSEQKFWILQVSTMHPIKLEVRQRYGREGPMICADCTLIRSRIIANLAVNALSPRTRWQWSFVIGLRMIRRKLRWFRYPLNNV